MKIHAILLLLVILPAATPISAAVVEEPVTYEHAGQTLQGYLAYDDAIPGKRPGVLVVHEWWGLTDYVRSRVRQLAGLGYVAFALDMYGKGKVTQHPNQAAEWMKTINQNIALWQGRARAGLAVLKASPRVDSNRLAAIGYCFGGATVQQLVYAGADLRGIVSFHGSPIPPASGSAGTRAPRILFCYGTADPFIKPEQLTAYAEAMGRSGYDWQMIGYGGAKHGFTNPDADKAGMAAVAYDADADRRSWLHMRMFFDEIFQPG